MQYLFKTRYNDDIKFLAKTGEKVRVAVVAILSLLVYTWFKTRSI